MRFGESLAETFSVVLASIGATEDAAEDEFIIPTVYEPSLVMVVCCLLCEFTRMSLPG
ncbi:hypothetical protein CULCOIPH002_11500 [Corynebacterium ulcerans]|uniref:Uncharacterized protein n=1 Tax=Corynebacterium ulcerans TaxID=65058 RepID=A0ABD0BDY7_CORUL|nr:hypothetical protein CULCOIPH001_07640 [Corynebacterium ulcerans]GJJ36238.1 hypothetical protein CULCOIPH002_11500 [Corynebacterium ulcerans]GJJ38571.1 hypothetical protein CULCOIPH003_12020 [Corynebacterium ulcerans]GJJ40280.1 hypothetical protein CULCOIPH004_06910 [Corynebacterium ulcerans]GJJ41904.1 hypothetical protein CULCOIPH005_00930 [Corynebacterium ulcerans]